MSIRQVRSVWDDQAFTGHSLALPAAAQIGAVCSCLELSTAQSCLVQAAMLSRV